MFKIRKTLIVTLLSIIFTNVGFAQSVKVTLSLKNSTLKELVSSVEKQTNYTFVFIMRSIRICLSLLHLIMRL